MHVLAQQNATTVTHLRHAHNFPTQDRLVRHLGTHGAPGAVLDERVDVQLQDGSQEGLF